MVADNDDSNMYEEARQKRLDENKKRFEELGILDISKSLTKLSSPEKKAKPRLLKSSAASTEAVEPRRSSRARNTVNSYQDDLDINPSPIRKKARFSSSSSSWTSYIARPLDEVKLAAYEDRLRALGVAEEFQSSLQSGNPSFVKSMVRSHVYSCFWLGLPTQFCKDHLPKKDTDMILEDENGTTCDARYLGSRTGLSGGWRGFALDHKLDDGDAVVFELVEPNKFKVYTFKVSSETQVDAAEEEGSAKAKKASRNRNKSKSNSTKKQNPKKAKASKVSNVETTEPEDKSESETQVDDADEDGSAKAKKASRDRNKSKAHSTKEQSSKKAEASKVSNTETSELQEKPAGEMIPSEMKNGVMEVNDGNKEVEAVGENEKPKRQAVKPRKKSAPKLFRRRA